MDIELRREDLKRMEQHAARDYPNECCGILLGKVEASRRVITDLFPVENARQDSARNRYLIRPEDFLNAIDNAKRRGVEVLGIYHSHPDQPAQPSDFDRQRAWPWLAYLILAVREGVPQELTAWTMAMDGSAFIRENLVVRGDLTEPSPRPVLGPI